MTAANARMAKQLVGVLEEAHQEIPSELRSMALVSGGGGVVTLALFGFPLTWWMTELTAQCHD
jgi:hypothetical protein